MPVRRYTDQERERGLVALAYASGNSRHAAKLLKVQGLPIPASTLKSWPVRYADLYDKARLEILPRLNAQLAEQHIELVQSGMKLEQVFRAKIATALDKDELPARDLPGGLRNVATSIGIHSDKARLLRGEPTTIVRHDDPLAILRSLRAKGVDVEIIDGEAEEVPDAA
jgi:hypothetical protein